VIVYFVDIGGIIDNNSLNFLFCFADIGEIIDHHSLNFLFCFADIGEIIDHHSLNFLLCFADIGEIIDHHSLNVLFCFADIGEIIDHHSLNFLFCFADIGEIIDHRCLNLIFIINTCGIRCLFFGRGSSLSTGGNSLFPCNRVTGYKRTTLINTNIVLFNCATDPALVAIIVGHLIINLAMQSVPIITKGFVLRLL
jgi:hypothetical protein